MPPVPSAQAIHNYQLIKLQNSEQAIAKQAEARMQKFKIISDVIINNDENAVGEYTAEQDKEVGAAIQRIFENISEMRHTHRARNTEGQWKTKEQKLQDVKQMQSIMSKLIFELEQLQTSLNVHEVAYADNLERIRNALIALEGATGFQRAGFKRF